MSSSSAGDLTPGAEKRCEEMKRLENLKRRLDLLKTEVDQTKGVPMPSCSNPPSSPSLPHSLVSISPTIEENLDESRQVVPSQNQDGDSIQALQQENRELRLRVDNLEIDHHKYLSLLHENQVLEQKLRTVELQLHILKNDPVQIASRDILRLSQIVWRASLSLLNRSPLVFSPDPFPTLPTERQSTTWQPDESKREDSLPSLGRRIAGTCIEFGAAISRSNGFGLLFNTKFIFGIRSHCRLPAQALD